MYNINNKKDISCGQDEEKNDGKSLVKNILYNSIGTLFYFGCQWLLTVLVVRFSGGFSDAGVLSLALSISTPLLMLANLNLRTFQISETEGKYSDGDFFANRILTIGLSFIISMCFTVYKGYGSYESLCIIAFMVYRLSEALADVLQGIAQKAWRLDIAGKSFLLRGIMILLSIVCGLLLNGNLFITILLLIVFSYLSVFFYDFSKCKKMFQLNLIYRRENVIALLKIGAPLSLYAMLLNLISIFPRFQIEAQYGKELLGIFASITTPTVLIAQLASFVFNPLMGIFAECRDTKNRNRLRHLLFVSSGGTVGIGLAALVAGNLFGEWALVLLFGESILDYAYLLIPIIYTAILTAFIWLLCGLVTVFKDYYMLAILTMLSFLFCLVFAPSMIAEKQLLGAVWILLLALSIEALLVLIRLIYLLLREKLL